MCSNKGQGVVVHIIKRTKYTYGFIATSQPYSRLLLQVEQVFRVKKKNSWGADGAPQT